MIEVALQSPTPTLCGFSCFCVNLMMGLVVRPDGTKCSANLQVFTGTRWSGNNVLLS